MNVSNVIQESAGLETQVEVEQQVFRLDMHAGSPDSRNYIQQGHITPRSSTLRTALEVG